MSIYSEPTNSKRNVFYLSNHPKPCTVNIPFCLRRRICMTVVNKNIRYMKLKEPKAILKYQKYHQMNVGKRIEKALAFPRNNLEIKN